ncbi:unnamed protein product, partial [Rotaria sp. Silwood2]
LNTYSCTTDISSLFPSFSSFSDIRPRFLATETLVFDLISLEATAGWDNDDDEEAAALPFVLTRRPSGIGVKRVVAAVNELCCEPVFTESSLPVLRRLEDKEKAVEVIVVATTVTNISQEYAGHNDSRIPVNTSHSTYEETDIDSNAHTTADENIIFNHQDYATTNNTDPVPAYTNDLSHGNIQMLSKIEERLRLNILRLLINLKNNNATETCIEICSRDLINVLNEYKDLDYVFNKKKQRQILRIHQVQYIPFKESLINLLKKPEVYESLDCRSRSRIMTDLSTGSFCEQHNLFKIPDSLKIILFYDDLGINNPLGSRAKSVGMFYWTLANLPR